MKNEELEEVLGLSEYLSMHWGADFERVLSTRERINRLREDVERKLAMVHEGTTVHTDYLLFLKQIDDILLDLRD